VFLFWPPALERFLTIRELSKLTGYTYKICMPCHNYNFGMLRLWTSGHQPPYFPSTSSFTCPQLFLILVLMLRSEVRSFSFSFLMSYLLLHSHPAYTPHIFNAQKRQLNKMQVCFKGHPCFPQTWLHLVINCSPWLNFLCMDKAQRHQHWPKAQGFI
jgi:hypothetical protein